MWKCSCGCINVGITSAQSQLVCAASRTSWFSKFPHQQRSPNTLDELRLYVVTRDTERWLKSMMINDDEENERPLIGAELELRRELERKANAEFYEAQKKRMENEKKSRMTKEEELFHNYYARGKVLVKDMDDTSLREHREQLRLIATEAKAQLLAADDEIRERSAKKSLKDKEWLATVDTSQSVSDAINVVEKRKARMSKMDKLRQQLIDAGLDDDTVKATIAGLERRATDTSLKAVTFKQKAEAEKKAATATSVQPQPVDTRPNPFAKKQTS